MTTIDIKAIAGGKAGKATLSDTVFGVEPNVGAMHQVVRSQLAARRSGTHQTKTRGNVRGGGAKPYRQKGTGRARQGSIRSPQYAGGGVVFGPHPRSYAFKVPNKVVKLAMRSALSAKHKDGELVVVNEFDFKAPSTKEAAKFMKELKADGRRVTLVVSDDNINALLSFRNLPKVRIITASESNTHDFVDNAMLVFTEPALTFAQEVLS